MTALKEQFEKAVTPADHNSDLRTIFMANASNDPIFDGNDLGAGARLGLAILKDTGAKRITGNANFADSLGLKAAALELPDIEKPLTLQNTSNM